MILTRNTTDLRRLVTEHVAADQVAQRVYWDAEIQRGCFIGCLNHSDDPAGAESQFGLPIMVQRIAESIFEALPADEAITFFAALPDAVHSDGMDLSRVGWKFLAAELRSLPEQPDSIQAVIDPVIAGMDLLAAGQEWLDAEAAACAANAAAWAAWAAAWAVNAAAYAVNAAAYAAKAAEAAADAADTAVDSLNARRRQRDLLLRLIAESPIGDNQ